MKPLIILIAIIPCFTWAECVFEKPTDLIEGKPIVKVAPMYPKRQFRKSIEGCVVIGYSLSYGPSSDKRGAYPSNLEVLHSTDPGAKQFVKASKKAITKWLFSPSTHPVSESMTHYSVIPFELSD